MGIFCMNDVRIALNICTYKREDYVRKNLALLLASRFFDRSDSEYYGRLDIYIVDNASGIDNTCFGAVEKEALSEYIHPIRNRNTGGSGGFQRGIEEIRKDDARKHFSHVIFMDDDVSFDIESFYLLFEFLRDVDEDDSDRPVAGRMLDADNPSIQRTAVEKWNDGNIEHVEFLRNLDEAPFHPGKVIYDADADYGGFWFCCYPYSFVKDNDILPFFIHYDDVEYGLRCGGSPIIIEGVCVRHETFEKRMSPVIKYYDTRNPLFVNSLYGYLPSGDELYSAWKDEITKYHVEEDWLTEYMLIIAMRDFLRGMDWLKHLDSEKYHKKLLEARSGRIKNAIAWRLVAARLKRFQ